MIYHVCYFFLPWLWRSVTHILLGSQATGALCSFQKLLESPREAIVIECGNKYRIGSHPCHKQSSMVTNTILCSKEKILLLSCASPFSTERQSNIFCVDSVTNVQYVH